MTCLDGWTSAFINPNEIQRGFPSIIEEEEEDDQVAAASSDRRKVVDMPLQLLGDLIQNHAGPHTIEFCNN